MRKESSLHYSQQRRCRRLSISDVQLPSGWWAVTSAARLDRDGIMHALRFDGCEDFVGEKSLYSMRSDILSQWKQRNRSDMTGISAKRLYRSRANLIGYRLTWGDGAMCRWGPELKIPSTRRGTFEGGIAAHCKMWRLQKCFCLCGGDAAFC